MFAVGKELVLVKEGSEHATKIGMSSHHRRVMVSPKLDGFLELLNYT